MNDTQYIKIFNARVMLQSLLLWSPENQSLKDAIELLGEVLFKESKEGGVKDDE